MEKLMLKEIKQFYVSYGFIKAAKVNTDDEAMEHDGDDIQLNVPRGKKLPQIVQADSLIEAIHKVDKYLRETQLATKYTVTGISFQGGRQSVLI